MKISKDGNDIAEFAYAGLGRRVRKKNLVADVNSLYYYNDNWQVLAEYNDAGVLQMWFVYGNYIDEALMVVSVGVMYDESADNNRGTVVYCGRRLP